jgi:hypothetical protein
MECFMLTVIFWVAGGMVLFSRVISSRLIDRGDLIVIESMSGLW